MYQLEPADIEDVLYDQLDSLIEHAKGTKHGRFECRDCMRLFEVKRILLNAFAERPKFGGMGLRVASAWRVGGKQ